MINIKTTRNASYKRKKSNSKISDISTTRQQFKNQGGILGGLKYVGGNFVAGVAGVGEGIVDLFAAAGAAISGDTEYAKYVFKDNQAGEWHQSLTEDYNPGKVMNFLGDVGHGLGQSSVFLLNAIPGLGQLGTAAFFTGIIGQSISNAADKTGDVGAKEVAYGVASGVTEGLLETYLGGAAKAAGSIGKGLVGNVAKNAVRKGLAKEILTGASEEFLEEAVGELTDVFWQRTTGVDKNASTSLKNVIYSGLVGAVSGGLSVSSTSVIKYGANQQRGKRIIQSGNAQTLVNTATSVADKLAGSGTDFKKAADWVTALRGDVDAYNKLTAEQKTGAKGQTILGEMQAALAFAELQASFSGVQAKIENSDESTRAAFAEYINQTVDKSKRNKDYTAEDIAKNTDNVAWQIAILDYVNGIADIDGAIAMEEAAQSKVAGEQNKGQSVINNDETVINEGDSVIKGGETVVGNSETVVDSSIPNSTVVSTQTEQTLSGVVNAQDKKTAASIPDATQGGSIGTLATDNSVLQTKKTVDTKGERIVEKADLADKSVKTVQEGAEVSDKTVEGKTKEKSADGKNDGKTVKKIAKESVKSEPKVSEAKESLTDDQRKARATERAQKWIEWEKKTTPDTKALNQAREYVKNFDNLENNRRLAITRMIQSAEGKVDKNILKGVSNIMAVNPKSDLEFRFADLGGSKRGLTTEIRGKTVIVIDGRADFNKTVKSTIAHELVHYLENRAGYKEFSSYVSEHAKPDAIERHRKRYTEFYRSVFTAELTTETENVTDDVKAAVEERLASEEVKERIKTEITASLVGDALQSERFLKRYANRDRKFIVKVGSWLKEQAARLKMTDEAKNAADVATEYSLMVDMLLQMPEVRERKGGTKYAFAGENADTADKMKLATAKEMLESGVDSETVRRETGWFKGYDGEWRFEIDDSNMEYSRNGFNPDYLRYKELELKFLEGTISNSELQELQNTPQDIKDINLHRLDQFVKHKSLFDAYPELKRVRVSFGTNIKGNGAFYPATFSIKINPKSEDVRKTLLHEIQHAVQYTEGFTGGTDVKETASYEQYRKTAGEIEARDVANRADLTAEERKNTRPDIDQEDVVFAESPDKSASIEIAESGRPVVVVRDDITRYASNDQELIKLVKQSIGKLPYVAIGKQKIKFLSDTKKEATFSRYTKWLRKNSPDVYKDKMRLFNHPSEIVLATTDYINEGLSHPRTDNIIDFARGDLLIDILGKQYTAEVVIGFTTAGVCELHDVVNMNPTSFKYKMRDALSTISYNDEHLQKRSPLNNSIPQKSDLSTDSSKKDWSDTKYDLADDEATAEDMNTDHSQAALEEFGTTFDIEKTGFVLPDGRQLNLSPNGFKGVYHNQIARIYNTLKGSAAVNRFIQEGNVRVKASSPGIEISADVPLTVSQLNTLGGFIQKSLRTRGYFYVDITDANGREIASITYEENHSSEDVKYDIKKYYENGRIPKPIRYDLAEDASGMLNEDGREHRLRTENTALKGEVKKMRSMLERMSREQAQTAKNERAEVFEKKDIELATKIIEGWTRDEVMSLTKGYELQGMTRAKREDMISQIYIALHEQGARGQTGPGSIAVKLFASQVASDYIDSAKIVGDDGKSYHLTDVYDEASVTKFKQELTDTLYGELSNMGKSTLVAEFVARMRQQGERFQRERFNDQRITRYSREVSYQGKKIRDIADHQKRDGVTEGLGKVTKALAASVDPKGNVSVSGIDKAMKEAAAFLEAEGMKAKIERDQLSEDAKVSEVADVINEELKYMVDEFNRMREGRAGRALTADEMKLAGDILRSMRITVERYNKEFINGHWVDIDDAATGEVTDLIKLADINKNKEYKTKIGELLGKTIGKGVNEVYFYKILSPEYVLGALEGYRDGGLLQSMYHSIRVAQQKSGHLAVQIKKPFQNFIEDKENRWESNGDDGGKKGRKYAYRDKLNVKTINVNGSELTLGEAIYLLMLTKREESHAGLREGGYITFDQNNQKKLKIKLSDINAARDLIYSQLDKTDIEFLGMAEEFFNKTASKIKYDADMKIFGFSNNSDGYYVPMIRDRYSRVKGVTDGRFSASEIVSLYSPSFTHNLVSNAKALEGKNIMEIINNHADGLADYSEMYLPLKAFDRVYNRGVAMNDGEVRSIREVLGNDIWNGTETYLKDLFQDIQGQRERHDNVVDRLVGKIRSGWVSSVLGANIKVVMTQTTSLGAATQVIEPKYIIPALSVVPKFKGETINALRERAYKHSDIIEARVFDMGALKAQGNVEKIGEIGKKAGVLIEKMDEQVCLTIFHAAELKVEALTGYAVGSEENVKAAAKIADEAIFKTQAMTAPSEKSALQRSTSEVAKTLSMFTSDVVKNLSHLWGNTMKYFAHKQRAKAGDAQYEAMLKSDAAEMRRSMRTLGITGLMMALITYLFKWLYAKEEEEPEDKAKDFAMDIFSSTFNIFPIVSDVFDKFVFNYDVSLNVFDMVNDTIEDTANMFKMAGNAMSGKFVSNSDIGRNTVNFIKSAGAVFGIPIAPVERTVSGLLRKFAPSTIYGYDSMFYNFSYTSDLKDAVESGDDALAEHILTQIYKSETTGQYTSEELGEVTRLYREGYTAVIPQTVGRTINDVTLNKTQRKQFNAIYSQASEKVNAMIRTAEYQMLTDEQKARAIKNMYALYYNQAASEIVGKEVSNAQMYSWLTNNYSALLVSQAYKSGLAAVKDTEGKEISVRDQFVEYAQNLKLSDSDYLVIAFANGVRDKKTKAAFIEYINSLKLLDRQKAVIAEKLSLEVKDGKLVEPTK